MEQNQASVTAMVTAFARAYHAQHDNPKIFDDFLAPQMFTKEGYAFIGQNLTKLIYFLNPGQAASNPDPSSALSWVMRNQTGSATLSRSRYTEECLIKDLDHGVKQFDVLLKKHLIEAPLQYVILGAGMDTFAFRYPDLLKHLNVFEVDHPASQKAKRQRLDELGWDIPERLHFIPVDFTNQELSAELKNSSFESNQLSFFSWLGVTCYLERDAIFDTLRSIATIAPKGSSIVFDYFDAAAFDPLKADVRMRQTQDIVKRAGEPMKTGFEPSELGGILEELGFTLRENLSPDEIEARFFCGTNGYHADKHTHFAWATVG